MHIKKRGAHYMPIIPLIALFGALMVFAIFFPGSLEKIMLIGGITVFQRDFLARDMATTITTLYSSPGNIILNYDKDTSWFSFEFNKSRVVVFEDTPKTRTGYRIINNSLNIIPIKLYAEFNDENKNEDNLKKKVKPIFAKISKDIIIDEEIKRNINEIRCIDTEPIEEEQIILIDAGHGGDDEGVAANNLKEKDITGSIGFPLYQSLGTNSFFTRDNIQAPAEEQTRKIGYNTKDKITEEVNTNNIGLIISIHTGSYEDNSNNVKAYYSLESNEYARKKSRKLACEIVNELIKQEQLEITGISIIGTYPEDYEGAQILVKDKIAILLEIGNLKNKKSVDILTQSGNIQTISSSIIKGLENAK